MAGVSRQTVSNALNAPHRVRAVTLSRVIAVIESLGYIPDQSARSLKTGLRYTLGYMSPDDDPFNPNPVMGGFLTALCDAAAAAGYRILLFRPTNDPQRAVDTLAAARQVDGFILSDIMKDDVRIERLNQLGLPFVAFGQTEAHLPQHWVDVDNAMGMSEVARTLAAQGHRHVAYVASNSPTPWLLSRAEGFASAAREAALKLTVVQEPPALTGQNADLVSALRPLLKSPGGPTAIVGNSDNLAMGSYEAIRAAGLRIGADVSVVGFDDLPLCKFLTPHMASVRMPLTSIAEKIVEMMLLQIRKEQLPPEGSLLEPELIIRESLCKVPADRASGMFSSYASQSPA